MGRPKLDNPPLVVQVKLRLYSGRDDDLISFFRALPKGLRSVAVKHALREGTQTTEVCDEGDDLGDALDDFVLG